MKKDVFNIAFYKNEMNLLKQYPKEEFEKNVKNIGFVCDMCACCCTGAQNDHVFLLQEDTDRIKIIDKNAIQPSPFFDFSDQYGNFYVPGYALTSIPDKQKSCYFLEGNRCRIYQKRPLICSVYPYMIYREPDEKGKIGWRIFGGLGKHGCYGKQITDDKIEQIWTETKKYETAYLNQEIEFRNYIQKYFEENELKWVRQKHAERIRHYNANKIEEATVYVYHRNGFEKNIVKNKK